MYTRTPKSASHRDIAYEGLLYTTAKLQTQARCQATEELCYVYTMRFFSALKKNEVKSLGGNIETTIENYIERIMSASDRQASYLASHLQFLYLI